MSSYSIQLPLDADGFLRRECPHCLQQFKWHHGPTDDRPTGEVDPAVYFCPLCGESAAPDQWWTQEQLDLAQQSVMGPALREISDELGNAFKGIKGMTYTPVRLDEPGPPAALHEPNDMVIVAPPCHSWEPLKVPEDRVGRVHCLLCGAAFAV
jgi:hypothetical protein